VPASSSGPVATQGQPVEPRAARRRQWRSGVGLVVVSLLVGAASGWAGRTLLVPPQQLSGGSDFTVVAVERSSVQRSLNLTAAAKWAGGPQIVNTASGVVTEHSVPSGARVVAGDVLYTVDLHPVVAMEGAIPIFRDLVPGHAGKDVRQLQVFLSAVGVRVERPTDRYDAATLGQVKAWQRTAGLPVTGTVGMDAVVAIPSLPGVLSWGTGGAVGSRVAPGVGVGRIVPPQPKFSVVLPQNQRGLVKPGMGVTIRRAEGTWTARLGTIGEVGPDGSATARLLPVQGRKSICERQCSAIPLTGDGALAASVVVIPPQAGPVVPVAALAV
jgi:peptidoglycan hydrolase-like protein with peptidoglycan-binding domain